LPRQPCLQRYATCPHRSTPAQGSCGSGARRNQ
jgi:hypothetical protein